MQNSVNNKVALLTGGTTGIGLVVAQQLVALGVRVVIAGRDQQQGQAAAATLGDATQALFVPADVRYETQVQALVQQTLDHYGQLDLLFNNAGTEGTPGPLPATTEQDLEDVLATNVKGLLLVLKHALPPLLASGGILVNTGSFIGTVQPFPEAMPYGASKAAVLSITRALAAGYPPDQLRAYAVCPWTTDTPMLDRLTDNKAEAKTAFGAANPSGRLATPADIAQAVIDLFTGQLKLPNGEAVLVDSGSVRRQIQPMSFANA